MEYFTYTVVYNHLSLLQKHMYTFKKIIKYREQNKEYENIVSHYSQNALLTM